MSASRALDLLVALAARQLRSWGSQVELVEAELEIRKNTFFALSADSVDSVLDLEARSANFSDHNEELMLSASDTEGLDIEKQAGASAEQLPQSAAFEELLEVVTRAVAKLKIN